MQRQTYMTKKGRKTNRNRKNISRRPARNIYYEPPNVNADVYNTINHGTPRYLAPNVKSVSELRAETTSRPSYIYQAPNVKSIRELRAATTSTPSYIYQAPFLHGYVHQQYGNYTNDRAYNDLQQQYRNLSVASNMNQVTLKNMNSANKALEDDIKKQHQQIQLAQKRKIELEEKLDKDKADLTERSRVERDSMKLRTDINNTEQQMKELQTENDIINLKRKKLQATSKLNDAKFENTNLKEQYEENELYNEIMKTKQETEKIVAENAGMQKEIESPAFQHPNSALIQAYEDKITAEDQRKLLQEQHDLDLEQKEIKSELSAYEAQSSKDEQVLTEQVKEKAKKKVAIRNSIYNLKRKQAKQDEIENLASENDKLNIEMKVNSAEIQQLKENANDDELSRISQEAGRTKAKKIISDANVNKTKQISNMNDEIKQNTAETTELNKHNSPQQAKANRILGETKTKLEQTQELLQTTKEEKASEKQRQIAEGASQYYNSPEYNKTDKKISSMKTATKINMRQKEMIELADKKQDQAIQSLHDLQAAEDARGIDTSDINDESVIAYQISNAVKIAQDGIDKEARNREEKESKISEVQDFINQNSTKWEHFVSGDRYRKYANFRYSPDAFDIKTIDQLYSDFLKYSKFNFPDDNTNNIEEDED